MLKELHIRNYALFEDVHIELGPNFNVFSGETGAGKSLLVGAIGLLLGNKGDSVMVRQGCSETEVIGILSIAPENREARDWLENCEIPLETEGPDEPSQLSVRRILKDNGKSSCYIQHIPLTLSKLGEFTALLFDLHSQHQNQSLFHSRRQLRMLDHYAHLNQEVETFGKTFQNINQKKKQLTEAQAEADRQREQAAYLKKAIEEFEELKPQQDEDSELSEQIELLSNAEDIRQQMEQLLEEGHQALELLHRSHSRLGQLSAKFKSGAELLSRLQSTNIEIEDILDSCKAEKNNLNLNPGRLQEMDQRLSKLIMLGRKYGNSSLNRAIQFSEEAAANLAALENTEDSLAAQKRNIQTAEKELMEKAQYLSRQRKKYAPLLQKSIEGNLHNLGMAQATFQIELSHRNNENNHVLCHSYGIDKVRFLLAANPGEDLHEIRQVASGGEISRIMLAIKSEPVSDTMPAKIRTGTSVNGSESSIETIIFDEIDTGIGGETGIRMARHINRLGRRKQILCVTHLASIAASADTHIKIEKQSDSDSTNVNIHSLSSDDRPAELARMLSGDPKNPTSLAHAQELLNR
ncbi:DNA repair protein RecN [Candidatus Haliotispira prima]|uniref:DNA repair protein RecN n=1 Tax=Candidatus Haliotispira prima TaxID=3034016 RepID=A0ABY8MJK3_9SPIO|nr:DNA repair protein RecN [Candidatus Haliotispira prima]